MITEGTRVRIMTEKDSTRKTAELYDGGMSLEQVGEAYGLTRQGVRHRFIKAGIVRRRRKQIDKKRLETLYSAKRLPISEIAGLL